MAHQSDSHRYTKNTSVRYISVRDEGTEIQSGDYVLIGLIKSQLLLPLATLLLCRIDSHHGN